MIRISNNKKMIYKTNNVLIDYLKQQKMKKNFKNTLRIKRLLEIIKIKNLHSQKNKFKLMKQKMKLSNQKNK